MSVVSEIERIKTNIANAYTEIENKGVVTTGAKNSDNLATTISAIQTGGTGGGNDELINSFLSSIDGSLGANCTKLPDDITSIGQYGFYNRTNLALTSLPDTVGIIGQYGFGNCTNIKLNKLSNGLYNIGQYAFRSCTNLDIHEIGASTRIEGVTYSLGRYAFNGCSGLKDIKIMEGFTTISDYSFENCTSLIKVDLPSTTSALSTAAFRGCTNLKTVICRAKATIPSCYENAFNSTSLEAIYVPDEVVSNYKRTSGWNLYSSIIKPLSEYTE